MCYDLSFFALVSHIHQHIPIDEIPTEAFPPTYHQVAQSWHPFPVVFHEDGKNKLAYFEWGLIASYMNTPEKITEYRSSMANARSEKLLDDPRSAWHRIRSQRCIVATTGFFEHRDIGAKRKLPYFIRLNQTDLFFLAGLYNYSPIPDAETGALIGTFTILTKTGNHLLQSIHNSGPNKGRMPVILSDTDAAAWISNDLAEEKIRNLLTKEFPASDILATPVHTIRTRKVDDARIIEALPTESVPPL